MRIRQRRIFIYKRFKGGNRILKLPFFHERSSRKQRLIYFGRGNALCGCGRGRLNIVSGGLRRGGRSKAYD